MMIECLNLMSLFEAEMMIERMRILVQMMIILMSWLAGVERDLLMRVPVVAEMVCRSRELAGLSWHNWETEECFSSPGSKMMVFREED